jgi:hypothetical protein
MPVKPTETQSRSISEVFHCEACRRYLVVLLELWR